MSLYAPTIFPTDTARPAKIASRQSSVVGLSARSSGLSSRVPHSTQEQSRVESGMSVGKRRTIVRNDRTEVAGRVVEWLREFYPQNTAASVAADLGLSVHAVEKWLSRESAPSLPTFGLMGFVYGPEFCAAVFPGWGWAGKAAKEAMVARLKARRDEADRQLEELSH